MPAFVQVAPQRIHHTSSTAFSAETPPASCRLQGRLAHAEAGVDAYLSRLIYEKRISFCCLPQGCTRYETDPIFVDDARDAVHVVCSNPSCTVGSLMHFDCFAAWEQRIMLCLTAVPSIHHRLPNHTTWTLKPGCGELLKHVTACICGRGQLRLNTDPETLRQISNHSTLGTGVGVQSSGVHPCILGRGDNRAMMQQLTADMNCASIGTVQSFPTPMLPPVELRGKGVPHLNQIASLTNGRSATSSPRDGKVFISSPSRGLNGSLTSSPSSNVGGACHLGMRSPGRTSGHCRRAMQLLQLICDNDEKRLDQVAFSRAAEAVEAVALAGSSLDDVFNFGTVGRDLRIRTTSYSSTGSSPPSSGAHSPPSHGTSMRDDWSGESEISVTPPPPQSLSSAAHVSAERQRKITLQLGNMFKHRSDLSVVRRLPREARNQYHVRVEDEGPHGNDVLRSFLLKSLTRDNVQVIPCVVCLDQLPIFDEFPLVDGTLFLSPKRYISDVKVSFDHRPALYLNAVCLGCLDGKRARLSCRSCSAPWCGSNLVVGTMYSYDVFAGSACCQRRLDCNVCRQPVLDTLPRFFSDSSRMIECPHCRAKDFHLMKPLDEIYDRHLFT